MATGITLCSVCSVHVGDSFCICRHPLQALCSSKECREVHESKAAKPFHYPLPIAAKDRIADWNHFDFLQRLFALQHIQSRFIESLNLFDTAVAHIEESYKRQVMALTALRDQYIEKVARLREATDEAFRKAVNETTEHAVDCEHIPHSDISEWICTMVSKRTDDNIPLFHLEIREIQEKDMELMFAVRMNSMFRSLATWDFGLSKESEAVQKENVGKLKLTVAELKQKTTHFECRYQILCKTLESSLEITQKLRAMSQEMEQTHQSALIDGQKGDLSPPQRGSESDRSRQHSPHLSSSGKMRSGILSTSPEIHRSTIRPDLRNKLPPITPPKERTSKRTNSVREQNSLSVEAMDTQQSEESYELSTPTWVPFLDAPKSPLQASSKKLKTPVKADLQRKPRTGTVSTEFRVRRQALSPFETSDFRATSDLKEMGKSIGNRA